jgi:hypothetical protein
LDVQRYLSGRMVGIMRMSEAPRGGECVL